MTNDRISKLKAMQAEDSSDPFITYALGLELFKTGEIKDAMELLINLMKDHPDYLGTYYQLGKMYEQSDNKEQAMSVYTAGIAACEKAGDQHALSELMSARANLGL